MAREPGIWLSNRTHSYFLELSPAPKSLRMSSISSQFERNSEIRRHADELFLAQQRQIYVRTDRLFAALMVLQWLACIITAFYISPRAWSGPMSQTHIHVWAA